MDVKRKRGGEILSLDDGLRLGVGGEGAIYRLPDEPDLAAKIYLPGKATAERVGKLRAMLANAPADPMLDKGHASIAWPVELLNSTDGDGGVVGFLMPCIRDARPLSNFYDADTRRALFPLFNYKYLCRTGLNLASAVAAIHERGYVIGDVNDLNIMATEEALVSLVDTDSFQVTEQTSGRVYRCAVGTPEFTPPELLGKDFHEVDRSREHDLFGLAVLFFQLLMEGTLPFACVYGGPGEAPEYSECLARGYFPYADDPRLDPPPGAPPFEALHPLLQKLFRRCFVNGHSDPRQRPDAESWYHALKESEQALTVCTQNRGHLYFDHCTVCPWCARAQRLGPAFAAKGVAGWDPFPQPNKGSWFVQSGNPAAQPPTAPRRSAPFVGAPFPSHATAATQPPVSFTASPAAITIGQPITLSWDIPNARTVRITDQSGRRIFVGNTPAGAVTVYPTRSRTYYVKASGIGVSLPKPVAVSVTPVPLPVKLKEHSLELNQPTPLRDVRVGLRTLLPLNEISVKLHSLLKLKHYSPLNSYAALKRASVRLKNYGPLAGATHG
ncbi:MAG: helix-hairpin-helix domain-containing protein [Pyrinomonadaceae bacterium]